MEHSRERRPGHGLDVCVHRFVDPAAAPSGTLIVCLHGFLDAGGTWDLVAERLVSHGHEVWAPDFRGFGRSDRVTGGGYYHFPDYVADLDAVMRADDSRRRVVVVGHSMGGTVACMYAGARPERVHQLVLMEGVGPQDMPPAMGPARCSRWLDQLARFPGRKSRTLEGTEDALKRLAFHHPKVDRDVLRSRVAHLTQRDDEGVLRWCYDPLHSTTAPSVFRADNLAAYMRAIPCPVLFIGGGESGWHPDDEAARIAELRSTAARVDLEGAGHMMHWTQPAEVASAITDFVAHG